MPPKADWEFKVRKSLLLDKKVSRNARFLYVVLMSFQSKSNPMPFPSLEMLASICCCDRRSIQTWLKELEGNGTLVKQKFRGKGQFMSNRYLLTMGNYTTEAKTDCGKLPNKTLQSLTLTTPKDPTITKSTFTKAPIPFSEPDYEELIEFAEANDCIICLEKFLELNEKKGGFRHLMNWHSALIGFSNVYNTYK